MSTNTKSAESATRKDQWVHIRTTSAEKQALTEIAEEEGTTVTEVVTNALKKVIRRRRKQVEENY